MFYIITNNGAYWTARSYAEAELKLSDLMAEGRITEADEPEIVEDKEED